MPLHAVSPGLPPGYEFGYAQITSTVNITGTTEATGTTIISPGAIQFDGAPVLVHFSAVYLLTPSVLGNGLVVCLFEGATQITRLASAFTNATSVQRAASAEGFYRFTPTLGSHTYTVTAFVPATTGTPQVVAGAGGTAADPPSFIRFTKV